MAPRVASPLAPWRVDTAGRWSRCLEVLPHAVAVALALCVRDHVHEGLHDLPRAAPVTRLASHRARDASRVGGGGACPELDQLCGLTKVHLLRHVAQLLQSKQQVQLLQSKQQVQLLQSKQQILSEVRARALPSRASRAPARAAEAAPERERAKCVRVCVCVCVRACV